LHSLAWSRETTLKLATFNKATTYSSPKLLELVKVEL
jgi:hypothetical protein